MFALFASCSTQYSAALRCAAGQITIDPKARHHTCCFFVDDACRFCLLVAVVLSTKPYMYWSHFLYVLGIAFFTVFVILGEGGAQCLHA